MESIEEIESSSYPSTAALRVGIFHILIGFGGIGCAIASTSIQLNLENGKDILLYGGLGMGCCALLVGIIAVISGKSKTGCCLLVTLMLFTIIGVLIASSAFIVLVVLFQNLKTNDKNEVKQAVDIAANAFVPDNLYSKENGLVRILCLVLMVLSGLEVLLSLFSSCFTCKGVCCRCCHTKPPYNRIVYSYPAEPQVVISAQNPLSSPVYVQ